jgi:hypothetical protein
MKIITIGETTINAPSCTEELRDAAKIQLAILRVELDRAGNETERTVLWILVLKVVLGHEMRKKVFEKWWKGLELSIDQIEALKVCYEWVMERPEGMPFEYFDYKGVRYYLPEARFKNTSAAEWTAGILDWIELSHGADNVDRIDYVIANFCRPKRADLEAHKASAAYNGDIREPYNRARAEETAVLFKDLNAGVKILVMWWYDELVREFFKEYEDLFGSQTDAGEEKKSGRYADGRGYIMVLKNAAKKHYMGDFKAVQAEDVNMVYSLLLDDMYDENTIEL